jgi:acyl phosphate:glycerol-3-phosphate acyltransferase
MWPGIFWGSVAILSAYMIGSLPTGFLISQWVKGIDVRGVGSGNVGATNVARTIGKRAGAAVLLIDIAKGVAGAVLVPWLVHAVSGMTLSLPWVLGCGLLVVIGHDWSCFMRFTGGKGIATSMGVLAGLAPYVLLVAVVIWLVGFAASRIVSVASIAASITVPVAMWWLHSDPLWVWFGLGLGLVAIYRHQTNIRKLLRGDEQPFSFKKDTSTP